MPNVGVSGRRKSSLEEIGISHFTTLMQASNHSNPIKIALNGSIGLEVDKWQKHNEYSFNFKFNLQVTPPEEPLPVLGVPCMSSGILPSGFGGSSLGLSSMDSMSSIQIPQSDEQRPQQAPSPQHLQGTIV